jgi:hypothetical protein
LVKELAGHPERHKMGESSAEKACSSKKSALVWGGEDGGERRLREGGIFMRKGSE